ncbi:hypothetical protein FRC07_012877 [Ceratobasidium sp. 392]|nr:hypothetical protein FRC07_012877 [Ceratobasidium sp. 392]
MPPKPSASKQSKSKASNVKQPAAQLDPKWIPLGKNTFNLVKQEWMQREFMARFIALDGRSKAKDKDGEEDEHGGDQEMTDDATSAQEIDKGKRKHDVSAVLPDPKSQADQLRLEMLEEFNKKFYCEADWNVLPRQMYNWLQKHKPDDAKAGGSTKSAEKSRSKSKPRSATIAEETEETHGRYRASYLLENTNRAWSAVDSEVLAERRERMVQDLDHVIWAVSRATGAEMVLYGVWEDGGVVNSMDNVNALTSVLPRWSSGQGNLPYALMKEDSKSKTFVLTDPERYPNGVKVFKHPFEMTTDELRR